MSGLVVHVVFFLLLAGAIVVMASFYSDPDDTSAFRAMPRRYLKFVVSCAVIAGIMLLAETLFASV